MLLPTNLRAHPLKFLLQIEWIILGLAVLVELLIVEVRQFPHMPALNGVGLLIFFLLGLQLPKRSPAKFCYLAAEIVLALLLSWVGGVRLFQVLFLVIVMRNCMLFEGMTGAMMTGGVYVLYAITQLHRLSYTFPMREGASLGWFSLLLFFGLMMLFLQMLVRVILQERRGREQLAIANERLRQYALKIEDQATLQERNRIAREIHDALGHSLTAFNLHVDAVSRLFDEDPTEAKSFLHEAKQIGAQALKDVRQSVSTLRSDIFQEQSLETALLSLIEEFRRTTRIQPNWYCQVPDNLPPALKVSLYRILQEALTNICKYADATQVEISIEVQWETQPYLKLMIEDNGQGFELNQTKTGFGLQGIQERTEALAGCLQIQTKPQLGCRIIACFPIHTSLRNHDSSLSR
jgi:signal transduction histidine kinase